MLKFGLLEQFKGSDTLLIWGDAQGLSRLQEIFDRLATGADSRTAVHSVVGASGLHGATVAFELGGDVLHVDKGEKGPSIVGRFSAQRFAEFAEKVAVLADPKCQSGHQYLDWPAMADIQIIVSKGEYLEDSGATP